MTSPGLDSVGSLGRSVPSSYGSNSLGFCFHCGKSISFLTRLSGERRFCSVKHRNLFQEEQNRLAMEALKWDQPVSSRRVPPPPARKSAPPGCGLIKFDLILLDQSAQPGAPVLETARAACLDPMPMVQRIHLRVPDSAAKAVPSALAAAGCLRAVPRAIDPPEAHARGAASPRTFEARAGFPTMMWSHRASLSLQGLMILSSRSIT